MISQSKLQKTLNRLTGPSYHGNKVREQLSRSLPVHVTFHVKGGTIKLPVTIEDGQACLRYKEMVAFSPFIPFADNEEMNIKESNIIVINEAKPEIKENYLNYIGAIVPVEKKIIA